MTHTKGPWTFCRQKNKIEIHPKEIKWMSMIAHVYASGRINGNHYSVPALDNARLIAAAPELLEACKTACDFIDKMISQWNAMDDEYLEDNDRAMLDNLRAVIAKAKGEA